MPPLGQVSLSQSEAFSAESGELVTGKIHIWSTWFDIPESIEYSLDLYSGMDCIEGKKDDWVAPVTMDWNESFVNIHGKIAPNTYSLRDLIDFESSIALCNADETIVACCNLEQKIQELPDI